MAAACPTGRSSQASGIRFCGIDFSIDTTPRTVEFTLNDGEAQSAVATTTITLSGPGATPMPAPTPTPSPTPAQALNISTRLRVEIGDRVMIGGFVIRGGAPKPVVIRGLGPSLVNSGIPADDVLDDPMLELRGPGGALILSNDNWKDSPQRSEIEGTIFEPADDREAVIYTTLTPGSYTAIVSGVGGTTGVGLVEIYDRSRSRLRFGQFQHAWLCADRR